MTNSDVKLSNLGDTSTNLDIEMSYSLGYTKIKLKENNVEKSLTIIKY